MVLGGGGSLWDGSYTIAESQRSIYLFILKDTVYIENPCIYTFENAVLFAGWEAERGFSRLLPQRDELGVVLA